MSQDEVASTEELKDKWLRAEAALDNLRKRTTKEIADARDQGEVHAAKLLLPVFDDLYRAMTAKRCTKKQLIEGIESVFSKFGQALEQLQIEGFDAEGQRYTARLMDAVCEVPTTKQLPGTVVAQVSRGYLRDGKLLQAAQVSVAVAPKEDT